MKSHQLLKEETNSAVYAKILKFDRERNKEIHCARCPYHKNENDHKGRYDRSWKNHRRKQFKEKK